MAANMSVLQKKYFGQDHRHGRRRKQATRGGLPRHRLAKPPGGMLTQRRHGVRRLTDRGKQPMKMIAYLLAIICVIAAVMYFVMPAGQLPTFMPGYSSGSPLIHMKHAIAAAVVAVVLFAIGWFIGRR
jgi:hypothetical protein